MARCTSMAVTVESTPPERAQMTRSSAHPLPDGLGGGLDEGAHGPQAPRPQMRNRKVAQNLRAPGGVPDLGVKLNPIDPPFPVPDGPHRAGVAAADDLKPRGHLFHHVAVAHPHGFGGFQAVEKIVKIVDGEGLAPVFPGLGRDHLAPQKMAQELNAVADAQDRHPQVQDFRVQAGGVGLVHAPGAAGKDDAPGANRRISASGIR
jgi:hypothetical protein